MNSFSPTVDGTAIALTLLALLGWMLSRFSRRWLPGASKLLLAPFSLAAAWACWWFGLSIVESFVETAGTWPRSSLALLAAIGSEAVLTLYVDHRGSGRGVTRWLPVGLRLAMIAVLMVILLEPIMSFREEHSEQRQVAVLLDASASMTLGDNSAAADGKSPGVDRRKAMRHVLLDEQAFGGSLLSSLADDYDVRLYEYAATARELKLVDWIEQNALSEPATDSELTPWSQATDTAAALRRVDGDLPLDELSGLIFLTDGCDHSSTTLQDASRRLAGGKVPVHSVVIGNQSPVRDAEIVSLQSPQQIFQGDSVSIRASVKADQLRGKSARLRLMQDGQLLEERQVDFTSDRHRETIAFQHEPEEIGIHEYTVELESTPGEAIEENNQASARLWVSKDHIRLLIVENRPRWEFRYLKNLFAGRDRSVYLQHVLLRPTRLAGVPDPPIMHASVARAFDDCEATALPRNEAEWLKFDVIVLGDVSPDDLGPDVMQTLRKFVRNRAGTLIAISGQQSMPHAFARTSLEEVLPAQLDGGAVGRRASPDVEYRLKIATGADSNVIMQQADNPADSNAIWAGLPELYWRHPSSQAKPGATVLAYAGVAGNDAADLQAQRDRALILWQRYGAGKVLQLTFDQTWRLRYGIGDKYHHKFWGQVLRWAVQDRLPAGTELVRMGTDRVLYRSEENVTVRARLLEPNRTPVDTRDTKVSVYLGDELVQTSVLAAQPDSGGMLLAEFRGLDKPGKYRVELSGATVDRLLHSEGRQAETISTDFAIVGADPAVELSDVVSDATIPLQLADWTGGIVTIPEDAASILDRLGPKSTFHRNQWTVPLWNRWPVIALFLFLASAEWVLRKATRLV